MKIYKSDKNYILDYINSISARSTLLYHKSEQIIELVISIYMYLLNHLNFPRAITNFRNKIFIQ